MISTQPGVIRAAQARRRQRVAAAAVRRRNCAVWATGVQERGCPLPAPPTPLHSQQGSGAGPPAWSQLAAEGRCAGGACRPSAHAPNEFADCPRRGGARQAALRAAAVPLLCLQGALGAAPALAPVGAPGLRSPPSARGRADSCSSMSPCGRHGQASASTGHLQMIGGAVVAGPALSAPARPARQPLAKSNMGGAEPERLWGRLPNVYRWGSTIGRSHNNALQEGRHHSRRRCRRRRCRRRHSAATTAPLPVPSSLACGRQAPTMEQLRRDPRVPFEGLPPVEQLVLAGPESHRCATAVAQLAWEQRWLAANRSLLLVNNEWEWPAPLATCLIRSHQYRCCRRYVRQDDALWDELHAGVLTTGAHCSMAVQPPAVLPHAAGAASCEAASPGDSMTAMQLNLAAGSLQPTCPPVTVALLSPTAAQTGVWHSMLLLLLLLLRRAGAWSAGAL